MSTDHDAACAVGIFIEGQEEDSEHNDINKLMIVVPEKSHKEKSFDRRTGAQLPDEKVIDEDEHKSLVVDGVEYEDEQEGLEAMARIIDPGFTVIPHSSQWGETIGYVIGLCLNEVKAPTACAMIKRVQAKDKEIRKLFKLEATNHVKIYSCLIVNC